MIIHEDEAFTESFLNCSLVQTSIESNGKFAYDYNYSQIINSSLSFMSSTFSSAIFLIHYSKIENFTLKVDLNITKKFSYKQHFAPFAFV